MHRDMSIHTRALIHKISYTYTVKVGSCPPIICILTATITSTDIMIILHRIIISLHGPVRAAQSYLTSLTIKITTSLTVIYRLYSNNNMSQYIYYYQPTYLFCQYNIQIYSRHVMYTSFSCGNNNNKQQASYIVDIMCTRF